MLAWVLHKKSFTEPADQDSGHSLLNGVSLEIPRGLDWAGLVLAAAGWMAVS